jgi:hypothetical protein
MPRCEALGDGSGGWLIVRGIGCVDNDVGFCGLLLDQLGAVKVADYEAHVGEGVFDGLALFF